MIFKEEYVCLMRGRPDEREEEIGTLNIQELNPMAEVYREFDINLKQWRKMCGLEHQPKFRTETASMNVHSRSVYVTTNIKKDDSRIFLFKKKLIEYTKKNFVVNLVYAG